MSTLRRRPSPAEMLAERAKARARRTRRIGNQRPPPTLHTATMTGCTTGPAAKTAPKRNRVLLDMARGRPCLLCPHGSCTCTPGSVVACHSNLGIHGKAGARKADDHYSVWGGDTAHKWLDQGGAIAERKEAAFMAAHLRQVLAWRAIATDPNEPARFRKAAQWALEQLGATPLGSIK